ncbi:hypothetical protein G7046_g9423 [Stylonectria norvegica]|nr:hypothetical protein G7046_g9423 [Stylonectria norvegica]
MVVIKLDSRCRRHTFDTFLPSVANGGLRSSIFLSRITSDNLESTFFNLLYHQSQTLDGSKDSIAGSTELATRYHYDPSSKILLLPQHIDSFFSRPRLGSQGNSLVLAYLFVQLIHYQELSSFLDVVKKHAKLSNAERHDAAVILTTPEYAKSLDDEAFMENLVEYMSDSEGLGQFHVLSAVVDHIASPVPSNQPIRGFSILRGHLHAILPNLWDSEPPRVRDDRDKVAALTFDLGSPRLTMPLSNTTFDNNRLSTLLASQFDLSDGCPRLTKRLEKHWQQINLQLSEESRSVNNLGLWAPLVPVTRPRVVTESFGNIVRRISVEENSIPASDELEPAVDELFKKRPSTTQGPMGIWALITPPSFPPNDFSAGANARASRDPNPDETFKEESNVDALVKKTSKYLRQNCARGARLYQILSGGGGWGAKKGLLSLDPQRTHFSLSEEEEMQRFIQAMDGGNFVPVGSKIQFFSSPDARLQAPILGKYYSHAVFGTAGDIEPSLDQQVANLDTVVLDNHFGALSNEGLFVSSYGVVETTPGFNNDWKLNVPHSRFYVKNPDSEMTEPNMEEAPQPEEQPSNAVPKAKAKRKPETKKKKKIKKTAKPSQVQQDEAKTPSSSSSEVAGLEFLARDPVQHDKAEREISNKQADEAYLSIEELSDGPPPPIEPPKRRKKKTSRRTPREPEAERTWPLVPYQETAPNRSRSAIHQQVMTRHNQDDSVQNSFRSTQSTVVEETRSNGNSFRLNLSVDLSVQFSGLITGRSLPVAAGQLSYAWSGNRNNRD